MGSSMAEEDPALTDADNRAIADIRRELDAEFGPLETPARLDVAAEKTVARAPAARRRIVAAFVLGTLVGSALGGIATFVWLGEAVWPPKARGDMPPATAPPPGATRPSNDRAAVTAPAENRDVASLHDALDDWIEATRRGDIPGQMRFYPRRVPVYYTWRDVPRAAVRAEKVKVFGAASRLLIATDTPTVDVAADHATAVTRFRKRYVIEGPAIRRRGEVLQELRWARTNDGWVIVGERDARVLAPE
jgi:hypothetical protein